MLMVQAAADLQARFILSTIFRSIRLELQPLKSNKIVVMINSFMVSKNRAAKPLLIIAQPDFRFLSLVSLLRNSYN